MPAPGCRIFRLPKESEGHFLQGVVESTPSSGDSHHAVWLISIGCTFVLLMIVSLLQELTSSTELKGRSLAECSKFMAALTENQVP